METTSGRSAVHLPEAAAPDKPPTKAQKQFKQLVARLHEDRAELARWREFRVSYHQRLEREYMPLAARLRVKRIALAHLLDDAVEGGKLAQRDSLKVRDLLEFLLRQLLAEAKEPALVELHDKYAATGFVDTSDDDDETESACEAEPPPSVEPGKGTRSAKAAAGGARAVRDVFRKLASELHPDRERDPTEQARKTELMQRANRAYDAGDLLSLIELQLSIEQMAPAALLGLAEEKLRHYNQALEQQSRRLREELAQLLAPFTLGIDGGAPGRGGARRLTTGAVQKALNEDIRELKDSLGAIEADLLRFRDIRALKQSLAFRRVR